jgi:hypothetical protein
VRSLAGLKRAWKTESTKLKDIFLDGLQGTALLRPLIQDLPYTPVGLDDVPLNDNTLPSGAKVTRCTLHCEAEGNFWQAMKDYAPLLGALVGGGAAAGCAIGGLFGAIGCVIGAIIGAIIGALAGGAAGAYLGANAAFNSDPGDVNGANAGDLPLGSLNENDQVVVFGTHVYDGFHEGWHEFHPLKAIIKAGDPKLQGTLPYVEWDPNWPDGVNGPKGLSSADMRQGLDSPAFNLVAQAAKYQWCGLLSEAFDPGTRHIQPQNRWTIHPQVDGCQPENQPPPIK